MFSTLVLDCYFVSVIVSICSQKQNGLELAMKAVSIGGTTAHMTYYVILSADRRQICNVNLLSNLYPYYVLLN